jgi:hypothetical protein
MTNNAKRATDAIETYVSEKRPNDVDQWREQSPESGWGMNSDTWFGVGKEIIDIFNNLKPQAIQINKNDRAVKRAIKKKHSGLLPEFENYITLKADSLTIQAAAIARMQDAQSAVWEHEQ